jgi:hypothetical protein
VTGGFMKTKFHVGQVVMYNDDPYKITYRFVEDGEIFFLLALHNDDAYDMASPEDLRRLTKKEKGD